MTTEKITRKALLDQAPAWAKAVIVAELEQSDCDGMTDYFASHTTRTVCLAWSPHTRDVFSEMRKAAAGFDETKHLGPGCDDWRIFVFLEPAGAPGDYRPQRRLDEHFSTEAEAIAFAEKLEAEDDARRRRVPFEPFSPHLPYGYRVERTSVEHREKWSMGHGYYLGCDRYSGWHVHKRNLSLWLPENLERLVTPAQRNAEANRTAAPVDGTTLTPNPEKNGIEIRFPSKPATAVLEILKANGWRWSRFSACWYHRDTPEARAFAETFIAQVQAEAPSNEQPQDLNNVA